MSSRTINPSYISYKPKINSRTVQGERNGVRVWVVTEALEGKDNKGKEGATGQATVPDDSRADVSVHSFWNWGTTTLFYM